MEELIKRLRDGTTVPLMEERRAVADALADELRDVLGWARTEKAPLRAQEIESIKRALSAYEA